MQQIYLASHSRARRKLLKDLGLKFKVLPSKIRERRSAEGISYAKLVKLNAQRKAEDVASRVKNGIIIAADTICVQDGTIFGKPKNLQDARSMLKQLSSRPQRLYTGLAVIEKGQGRQKLVLDYEQTRIYMDKLSGVEISRYFKQDRRMFL
jgi:septum formation protein